MVVVGMKMEKRKKVPKSLGNSEMWHRFNGIYGKGKREKHLKIRGLKQSVY